MNDSRFYHKRAISTVGGLLIVIKDFFLIFDSFWFRDIVGPRTFFLVLIVICGL